MTCMCCTPQNQQASWVDGSEWSYSNWMPGHPNIHTNKPVCVEMFKMGKKPSHTHKHTEVSISQKTSLSGRQTIKPDYVTFEEEIAHSLS